LGAAREAGQRLTHQLRPSAAPKGKLDESTPTRRARPAGVLGAEVWVRLVEPGHAHPALGTREGNGSGTSSGLVPSAQSQVPGFLFLTMTTRPSLRAEFKAGEGGKAAVSMARSVTTRGGLGLWSDTASATVAA
jgi:hypothetical protein